SRRPTKYASGVANVLNQLFQAHKTPHIPAFLPRYGCVAHLPMAQRIGRLRRQTGALILSLHQEPVELDLLGQLRMQLLAAPSKHEVTPGTERRARNRRPHAMFSTFSMASITRVNSSRSVASCFRPAAVNV